MIRNLVVVCLLSLAACAPCNIKPAVNHVVLVWLKPGTAPEVQEKIIEGSKTLKSIGQIRELQVGTAIPSDRPIVDDSFSLGILMRFDSVEDMNTYIKDPRHVQFVDTWVKPYLQKIVVYDF
ncbi:MAG TPA: Dabb family protein [Gammaproteobacteria bacterium]|nr:Dabb family protein [Gammaproteobacteria bacterium]